MLGSGSVVALVVALSFSCRGVNSGRLHNPEPRGTVFYDGVPRANPPWLGIEHWPQVMEISTVVVALGFWVGFGVLSYRQRRMHPGLILMIASTGMLVFDPFVDWSAFVVFDPRLLHFPSSWPYVSLTPGVEPVFVLAGYPFYFLIPGAIAVVLFRRILEPRLSPSGWFARHKLVTVFLVALLSAIAFNILTEFVLVSSEIWSIAQAPGPVLRFGSQQFPIVGELLLFPPVLASTAVMLIEDDGGRTLVGRFVERHATLRRRPLASQLLVAFGVYAVLYAGLYGGGMALLRMTGVANHIQTELPYGEMKVYDPQGRYEQAGVPGPYYKGVWSGQW